MAKKLAIVFGIVFLIVGILGFLNTVIIGSTGYFMTDNIHNIVHLLVGIILLIGAGMGEGPSALWLKIFGVVFLILFVDGLIEQDMVVGFIQANMADAWLHLVLGIVLLIAGFSGGKSTMMMDKGTM